MIILKKGLTVTGQVVDAAGQPVKRARVVMGRDIWDSNPPTATTNESGAFTLENCDRGSTIVTVQAEGFAPQICDVRVKERAPSVEIRLTEPASIVRGKVVDVRGKPVIGAFVAADTWRGYRSVHFRVDTDRDGQFVWRSAPKDFVMYDIGHEGYMASRHVPLIASDQEHVVTLHPRLMITGRVTDAETGREVLTARVVPGGRFAEGARCVGSRTTSSTPRAVNTPSSSMSQAQPCSSGLRQRATSRPSRVAFRPDEGRQSFDFKLQRTDGLSGRVLLPDGSPVPGLEVVLATRENRVDFESGRLGRDANARRFKTGPDGFFAFTPPKDNFLLIAVSDEGYADASSSEFGKSRELVLQPWGRIEGGVRIGPRAGSNEQVAFNPTRPDRGGGPSFLATDIRHGPTNEGGSLSNGLSPVRALCRE